MRKAPTTSISDMMSSTIIMTIFICRLRSMDGASSLVFSAPETRIGTPADGSPGLYSPKK